MNTKRKALIHCLRADKRGAVAIVVALGLPAIAGMLGLVAQETILYRTQAALQASANIAALAGAQDINCSSPCTPGTAQTTATSYSAVTGNSNAIPGQPVTMANGYPQLKCLTSTGLSCTGPDNANAIVVRQQAAVPLAFGGLFGLSTTTLTATATASRGGKATPLDVMLVVDSTASMNTADPSCGIPGATRVICALAGARILLVGNPSASPPTYGFPPSLVQVGLMLFPGVTNSTKAYDYDCASSPKPTIRKYNASPTYQIIGLSSDYKTSDTATSLNTNSNLVRALRGGANGCKQGLDAVGGVSTYYADIITAAHNALTTNGRLGVQKVIIFLSDGDANAPAANVPPGKGSDQCQQGITAAQAATAADTKVYSLAYGAPTSGSSCPTDSSAITACQAMQQIASTSSMFYSDTQNGSSACTSSTNTYSELLSLFTDLGTALSAPRLVPNGAT